MVVSGAEADLTTTPIALVFVAFNLYVDRDVLDLLLHDLDVHGHVVLDLLVYLNVCDFPLPLPLCHLPLGLGLHDLIFILDLDLLLTGGSSDRALSCQGILAGPCPGAVAAAAASGCPILLCERQACSSPWFPLRMTVVLAVSRESYLD